MQILFNELKNYKISLLLILVFTYISTTCELMIPLLLANSLNIGIIENYGLNYIKNIVLIMIIFITISIILNFIINYLTNRISIYASNNIKNNLFSKIITLKNTEKNKFSNSSLFTRTTQDISAIQSFINSFITIVFKAPILFINCITVLHTINKNYSLLIIISIITLIFYLLIVITKLLPLSKKLQIKVDTINNLIKEKITNIKILKSYNKLSYQDKKIEDSNNNYLLTTKKAIKLTSFVNPFLNLIINIITIIILSISINQVANNTIDVGSIVATIQYILQILLSIIMLSMIIVLIPKTNASLIRIKEVMDCHNYNEQTTQLQDINNITLNNVSFNKDNKIILENINLSINRYEHIGIIGPTGSGKSTLAQLILKEYETTDGSINLNNININEITRKDITTNITYLPQTPSILTGTILENIAFANTSLNQMELSKIIHTCNLTNFIMEKQEKLNYRLEQNGANLSTGQKQRICLARALAANTNTLILDEPFSALDYKNEKEIINNLKMYYPNKTFITISQRISSLIQCNKIIFLDKGRIIATGSHTQLLEICPKYKEIYDLQKEVLEYDN